ncbi:hypothetical protein Lfu02_24530 [Longispora fulva]|uniref:ATP-NAD kinase n=1 Tax=Longispora fulva TaxID=619741 RepID=A0A8J7KMU2_9ACTN|nr:hypothetical protein [Longispora fulva]MBG6139536.1 hypothetical protein [Longispora fulva]GIG58081.1 hypothetical protein Lfu02_24530 [Longispora fulva]
MNPRVVVVSRRSELDELLGRHGTRGAAAYFLKQRGRDLVEVEARHAALQKALTKVGSAIPVDWRRGRVVREDLSRFLFGPEDVVVAVGPDGLVANVAKYLDGQPVIGVNPEPDRNPGVLVRHPAGALRALLRDGPRTEDRAMVSATLDDGETLIGLNEVYVGHATHQSARYALRTPDGGTERQSSSGIVVSTGTGATGWCASIVGDRWAAPDLPAPVDPELVWFVREAWPSPGTGTELTMGLVSGSGVLEVTGESERLVAFADGLEDDHLTVGWGQRLTIGVATRRLRLVVG